MLTAARSRGSSAQKGGATLVVAVDARARDVVSRPAAAEGSPPRLVRRRPGPEALLGAPSVAGLFGGRALDRLNPPTVVGTEPVRRLPLALVADGVVEVSRRPDRGRLVQVAKELGAPALPLLARGVDAVPARVVLLDVLNQEKEFYRKKKFERKN